MADNVIRFTKIKHDPKKQRLVVEYTQDNGTDEPDSHRVTALQPPHPDLLEALAGLRPHVLTLCELAGVEEQEIEVRSVSFSWANNVMGATITGLRKLRLSMSPLVLNTPHKTVDHYSERGGDDSQLLPDSTVEALDRLVVQARLFLPPPLGQTKRGEREQTEMELEGEDAEESTPELAGV